MEDLPRTEHKDRLEQLRKMEFELKGGKPSKDPPMTALAKEIPELRDMECYLAYLKLTILDLEDDRKVDEARPGKIWTEEREADLARVWQSHAKAAEYLRAKQAQFEGHLERATQENAKTANCHECQSKLQKDASLRALTADMNSRLDGIVTYLTPKEGETSSESPKEEAQMASDISQEGTEAENDTALEEGETEDDIRQESVLANIDGQMGMIRAQTNSLSRHAEIKAQNDAFFKKHDEFKAQRQRWRRDALEKAQEMSLHLDKNRP